MRRSCAAAILLFLAAAGHSLPLAAQAAARTVAHTDRRLQAKVEALVRGFHGDVGVYIKHLRTGRTAAVHADELFPTASLIKVPILLGTFDAMQRGQLSYDSLLTFRDSLVYSRDDLSGNLRDSTKVALAKLTLLMISLSDNTASLWLQGLVGGATINAWLHDHGFDSTRVNSRVPGREAARTQFGWGQTTPRELAGMLTMIREGRAVDVAASEAMYRTLTRSYWNGEALSQVPPWVQVASKQGMVNKSRSEVVLVNAPSGDYVFAIATRNQQDSSWTNDNEGYVVIRKLSAMLWKEFEPRHPYTPPPTAKRFLPPEEP
ncbi:MAG: serine hydrolase [Gemmatimonadaceae bacterium]|nr:serine hydrolase [Gemmatimonadaceae bacterium]